MSSRLRSTFVHAALALALGLASIACGGSDVGRDSSPSARRRDKDQKAKSRPRKHKKAESGEAAYLEAINAEADGELQAANDHYRDALKLDPSHRKANRRYVHFLIDNHREEKALKVARAFYEAVPQEAISYHTLADAEAAAGQHEQVIGTMSGLLAFSETDASAFEKRGRARLTIGEDSDGIKDIRRAVEMEPDNPEFLVSLGAGLLRGGKNREARSSLIKALQVDERNARAHLLLGILARGEGRMPEAIAHHKSAVEFEPSDARAHYELGISYNVSGENQKAEESLAKAVDVDPETGTYWYGYGDLLRLLGRLEESAAAYRQSVRLEPQNGRAWQRLGEVLIESGELSDAAKQLKRGMARVKEPRLHFLLAQVYLQAKKQKRAIDALEDFLKVAAPDDGERRAAEKLLKDLKR